MAGYTPAFSSIYDGTLFGKWPTAVVWASLLPLIDAQGEINLSYEAIAGRTGWPMDLLKRGIDELMQPDPGSRSGAEEGRRMVLLNPEQRSWGWRIVNVRVYRDRASGKDQVTDGRNAEKVKRYKERHRKTPTDTDGHRRTPSDTYSDSDSDSDSDTNKNRKTPSESLVPQKRDAGPAERVFDHWRSEFRHPKAVLDAKRRKVIAAALASFDEATVCSAISGYKLSPHHMGENDQRTVYDDIGLLLRDVAHIESGLNFARAPPKPQISAVERAREKLRNGNGNGRVVIDQSGTAGESGLGAVTGLLRRIPDQ
jgi:hypothetical protein